MASQRVAFFHTFAYISTSHSIPAPPAPPPSTVVAIQRKNITLLDATYGKNDDKMRLSETN